MARFQVNVNFSLNYNKMLLVDAEDLAEGGIKEAYDRLVSDLKSHVSEILEVGHVVDSDAPSYTVEVRGVEYVILSPAVPKEDGSSWGRATYVFFKIGNDQLADSDYRLYAINGWERSWWNSAYTTGVRSCATVIAPQAGLAIFSDPRRSSYGQFHD
jgi:hypothetical protein